MIYRTVSLILLLALLPQFTGCSGYYRKKVPTAELSTPIEDEIVGVTTVSGRYVKFDRASETGARSAQLSGDTIYARMDGRPYQVAIDQVTHVWLRSHSGGLATVKTIGAVIGVAAVVLGALVLIALATKDSCPFLYSWDGQQYVFDAEPFGGAITRGLERDDYGELEHLRPEEGAYRLRITNEVRETQYTNFVELWVVDHQQGVRVIPDEWGNLHAVADARALLAASDQGGGDLMPWLAGKDQVIWEPAPVADPDGRLRDDIILTFPRPAGARQARLIANVATGLWGSYMISEMLELRGDQVEDWYSQIDGSRKAVEDLYGWNVREGTYLLAIEVETEAGWEVRGLLPGGGPFIAEDRVVPLDIRGARAADQLRIRIRPPRGYWALNWFAIDYGTGVPAAVDTLAPTRAVDHNGLDVRPELLSVDDRYYEMPRTGDYGEITFPAPPERPGLERTIILHSRGYYRLHLNKMPAPDLVRIQRLVEEAGYAAVFAAERYDAWLAQKTAEP